MQHLEWKDGFVAGWLVAYPIEGDRWTHAAVHRSVGQPDTSPAWRWKVRTQDHLRSGTAYTRQSATHRADEAWCELIGAAEI